MSLQRSASVHSSTVAMPSSVSKEENITLQYISRILRCYTALSIVPDLQPSAAVDKAFNELVAMCTESLDEFTANGILANPKITKIIPHLQKICSVGEGMLEQFWARKFIAGYLLSHDGPDQAPNKSAPKDTQVDGPRLQTRAMLGAFPYFENYVDLTAMELSAISLASPETQPQRFAFLGCGPLPLTSFCILDQELLPKHRMPPRNTKQISIVNIDHDPVAINSAKRLWLHLSYEDDRMEFLCEKAEGGQCNLKEFDVVYVAALVGSTGDEKRKIFQDVLLRMRRGALLVVRSAHSLRKLLYPVVNVSSDFDGELFEPLIVIHPYNHIINSVIVGRVK